MRPLGDLLECQASELYLVAQSRPIEQDSHRGVLGKFPGEMGWPWGLRSADKRLAATPVLFLTTPRPNRGRLAHRLRRHPGMGVEPSFWAIARVLAEILPEGEKERTMLLGLTGNRDALSQAAAKSTATVEELTLFELGAT